MPRILIVDDEPLVGLLIQSFLEELKYEALGPAETVSTALHLIETSEIDGAVLDLSLGPDQSYGLAERLRERAVPFAFATGRGEHEIGGGFEGTPVLAKPFTYAQFCALLDRLLPDVAMSKSSSSAGVHDVDASLI